MKNIKFEKQGVIYGIHLQHKYLHEKMFFKISKLKTLVNTYSQEKNTQREKNKSTTMLKKSQIVEKK